MLLLHQSTSGTKISSDPTYESEGLLNYGDIKITISRVILRARCGGIYSKNRLCKTFGGIYTIKKLPQ